MGLVDAGPGAGGGYAGGRCARGGKVGALVDCGWLKPNSEKPRKRGSGLVGLAHPPSTAGLDRFAASPVNGA